jgi:hypothetical protein
MAEMLPCLFFFFLGMTVGSGVPVLIHKLLRGAK